MNPSELVSMLNLIVNGYDALTDRYQLEKIKTIGDAYFCVVSSAECALHLFHTFTLGRVSLKPK